MRARRRLAVILTVALLAPVVMVPATAEQAQSPPDQAAQTIPDGARPLAPEVIREWNEQLFQTYRDRITTITGERDADGRLILHGAVVADTTQIGLLMVKDGQILDLQNFVTSLQEEKDSPRTEKVELGQDLEQKAAAVRGAKAAMEDAKSRFDSFQADEIRYGNEVIELERRAAAEDWDGVDEMQAQIEKNYYYQFIQARGRFVSLVDHTPLLSVEVDGIPLYEAFGDPSLFPSATPGLSPTAANQRYVDLLNTYLDGGIAQGNEQITFFSNMTAIEDLAQLASPRYAAVQNRFIALGQSLDSEFLIYTMSELRYAADGSLKDWSDEAWDKTIDQGLIVVAVGSLFLPGGVLISAAVSEVQIYRAADDLIVAYQDANQARTLAPVSGYAPVLITQEQLNGAGKGFFITVGASTLDAFGVYRWAKIVGADDALRAEQAALAATRNAPGNLPPNVSAADTIIDGVRVAPGSGTFGPAGPAGTAGFNQVLDPNALPGTAAFGQVLRPDNLPLGAAAPHAEVYLLNDMANLASPNFIPANLLFREANDLLNIQIRAVDGLTPTDFLWLQQHGGLPYINALANRGFILGSDSGSQIISGGQPRFWEMLGPYDRQELAGQYVDYMARNGMSFAGDVPLPQLGPGMRGAGAAGDAASGAAGGASSMPTPSGPAFGLPLGTLDAPAARAGDPVRITREGERVLQYLTAEDAARTGASVSSVGSVGGPVAIPPEYFELVPFNRTRSSTSSVPPAATPPSYGFVVPATGSSSVAFNDTSYPFDPQDPSIEAVERVVVVGSRRPRAYTSGSSVPLQLTEIRVNPDLLSNGQPAPTVQNIEIVPRNDGTAAPRSGRTMSQPPTLADLLLAPFRQIASARMTRSMRSAAFAIAPNASALPFSAAPPGQPAPQGNASATPSAKIFLIALGGSAGKVMQMIIVNDGNVPLNLVSDGFAAEPVARVTKAQIDRELARLKNFSSVTATVDAYCLDMAKLPPTAGMVFRVAGPAVQERHAAVRPVMNAARQLWDAGRLTGGAGDPNYEHGVRQWAIWTLQERFADEAAFTRAFVDHTRKTATASRQPWTRQLEDAVRGVAPGRWRDVQAVLSAAGTSVQ